MIDREQAIEAAVDRIEWYVRCLRDCWAGRVVRGLDEAEAGYASALDDLRAALPDPVHEAAREVVASCERVKIDTNKGYVGESIRRLRAALADERVPDDYDRTDDLMRGGWPGRVPDDAEQLREIRRSTELGRLHDDLAQEFGERVPVPITDEENRNELA